MQIRDVVKLSYLENGSGATILLIPGWTMPAFVWKHQLQDLASDYRVIALDPRGQGCSENSTYKNSSIEHAKDIHAFIEEQRLSDIVLVGWSYGVLDTLSYVHQYGTQGIAGIVLVDNSVGEDPPPRGGKFLKNYREAPKKTIGGFVLSMFKTEQSSKFLSALTQESLKVPVATGSELLTTLPSRTYWRDAVYAIDKPLLYAITPKWVGQANNLKAKRPESEIAVFNDAGHALFIDQHVKFNRVLSEFVGKRAFSHR